MQNVAQLLLMCDRHDIGLSVDGGTLERSARSNATGGLGGVPEALAVRAEHLHLRQLSRRHRLQPAAVRDARGAARAHARADRRLPVRVRLSVVRRARRQHRPAREAGGVARSSTGCSRREAVPDGPVIAPSLDRQSAGRRSRAARADRTSRDIGGYEARHRSRRASARSSAAVPAETAVRAVPRHRPPLRGGPLPRRASRIGDCEVGRFRRARDRSIRRWRRTARSRLDVECTTQRASATAVDPACGSDPDVASPRTLFIDLETTGLSGGAGTVAFLVGCGWFDLGAFQVRQFLLTSYAARARAAARRRRVLRRRRSCIVTYNGKTFDVPVMETRWAFHRMPHAARRRAALRHAASGAAAVADARRRRAGTSERAAAGSSTLERVLFDVTRVGDVPGLEIPARYLPVPAQRRSAAARAGARAQPSRSRLARGGDGAGPCSSRATARTRAATRGSARARPGLRTRRDGRSMRNAGACARRCVLRAGGGSRARRRRAGSALPARRCGSGASAASTEAAAMLAAGCSS